MSVIMSSNRRGIVKESQVELSVREAFQKKKDKLGLLAQPRGGRGRKGLVVPNPLNRFIKICLK